MDLSGPRQPRQSDVCVGTILSRWVSRNERVQMRLFRLVAVLGSSLPIAAFGVALPAAAAGSTKLPWHHPNKVTSGLAFHVASTAPCPPLPNPGDTLLVGITVTLPAGAVSDILSANSDGSWSGGVTFTFTSVPRQGSISADCEDFNGISATPYALYQTHRVKLISS